MFKLIVESGPTAGETFEVRERATVGRLKGAEITIPDASVSRQHARLLAQGDRLLVRDLDSANGVFVNGGRITSGEVRVGDRLRIGKVDLRVEGETGASAAPPAAAPPTAAAPQAAAPQAAASQAAASQAAAPSAPPSAPQPSLDRIATRTPTASAPTGDGMQVRQKAKVLQFSPYARGPKDRGLLSSDLDQRSGLFKLGVAVVLIAVAVVLVLFSGRVVEWILPTSVPTSLEEMGDDYLEDAP